MNNSLDWSGGYCLREVQSELSIQTDAKDVSVAAAAAVSTAAAVSNVEVQSAVV